MARKIGEAFVRVRPDTAGFVADARPGTLAAGHGLGTNFSHAFAKTFAIITTALGAVFAVKKVFGFLQEATQEQRESLRLARLTEAVIKSTGGSANLTTADIGKLSDKLAALAGVDDEVIQSGANMLLTFREVKNQVGEGNDIFDQASKAILDMSVAMNNGTTSEEALRATSLQVGKALNDPITGMNALRRAGVTFSEEQKKQIKGFQAAGDLMSAQKIILQELAVEFGGAAEAAADPAQRAQVAWENFKESLGQFTLPILNQLSTLLTETLVPAMEEKVLPVVRRVSEWVQLHLVPALKSFARWVGEEVMPRVQAFWAFLSEKLGPVIADLGRRLREDGGKALEEIKKAFKDNEPQIREFLAAIKEVASFILEKVVPVLGPLLSGTIKALSIFLQGLAKNIAIVVDAFHLARLIFDIIGDRIAIVKQRFGEFLTFVRGMPGQIRTAIGNLGSLLYSVGQDIVQGLWNGISSLGSWLWNKVTSFIRNSVTNAVRSVLGAFSPSKVLAEIGRDTVRGFWQGVNAEARATSPDISSIVPTSLLDARAAIGGGSGPMVVQNLNVSALTGRFSLRQVQDELAWHGVH